MDKKNMTTFEISHLDHVAIRVKDMETTIQWYETVLGLKKYRLELWGDVPIFMLAGKVGVAIFPANQDDAPHPKFSKNVKIDHFAFHVTNENFERAKQRYTELGLSYSFQNHHYYHSIYTNDPDGHTVELTTLVVDDEILFK
jgi:catechol 2,3-dioxygenase-like lactoylglutathione lyase family enzyme